MKGGATMMEMFFAGLGLVCFSYGLCVLSLRSGTLFFAVWFVLSALCFGMALGLRFDLFSLLPKVVRFAAAAVAATGLIAACVAGACIAGSFNAHGEPDLDYVIVLGAQVKPNGEPSPVLRYRLDAAADYLAKNPRTRCIVTGGQGFNEPTTEAFAMASYLVNRGVSAERIILEPEARNTQQNIAFSKQLMDSPDARVGIVTNDFHVFRGVALAKKQGVNACGIAAHSKKFFLANNALREMMGIAKDFAKGNI